MSFELIFTSAERGLKPGTRGFTTVAMTQGMPMHCVQLCEALSGYVHVYNLNDPRYELNPVSWSHYRMQSGGRMYSVLSRVASHSQDYTGRTNKIAHHLMLENPEETSRLTVGPAGFLQHHGRFMTQWTGSPRYLPSRAAFEMHPDTASFRAETWARHGLDPEWAALAARAMWQDPVAPVCLIFDPSQNHAPIALITDVLRLLPPERRWGVTFSSYLTSLPAGADCGIRACMVNSDAASKAARLPRAIVIDIAQKKITGDTALPAQNEGLTIAASKGHPPLWKRKEIERLNPPANPEKQKRANAVYVEKKGLTGKASGRSTVQTIRVSNGSVQTRVEPNAAKSPSIRSKMLFAMLLILMAVGIAILAKFRHDEHEQPEQEAQGESVQSVRPLNDLLSTDAGKKSVDPKADPTPAPVGDKDITRDDAAAAQSEMTDKVPQKKGTQTERNDIASVKDIDFSNVKLFTASYFTNPGKRNIYYAFDVGGNYIPLTVINDKIVDSSSKTNRLATIDRSGGIDIRPSNLNNIKYSFIGYVPIDKSSSLSCYVIEGISIVQTNTFNNIDIDLRDASHLLSCATKQLILKAKMGNVLMKPQEVIVDNNMLILEGLRREYKEPICNEMAEKIEEYNSQIKNIIKDQKDVVEALRDLPHANSTKQTDRDKRKASIGNAQVALLRIAKTNDYLIDYLSDVRRSSNISNIFFDNENDGKQFMQNIKVYRSGKSINPHEARRLFREAVVHFIDLIDQDDYPGDPAAWGEVVNGAAKYAIQQRRDGIRDAQAKGSSYPNKISIEIYFRSSNSRPVVKIIEYIE